MGFGFFWGLVRTPMAVGMALSFIAPIIALYLAAAFLGERVTRRRWRLGAGAGGGGGDRPGAGGGPCAWAGAVGHGGHFAFGGAYAANLVMQRHQARLARPPRSPFSRTCSLPRLPCPAGLLAAGHSAARGVGAGGAGGAVFGITWPCGMGLGAGAGASLAAHRIFGLSVGRADGLDMVCENLDFYTLRGWPLWPDAGLARRVQKGARTIERTDGMRPFSDYC
jgi:S-adenosylmethionine uptake transporter